MPVVNANSVDPDQILHSVASDLGLHCLPMSHLWDARHKWGKSRMIHRILHSWSFHMKFMEQAFSEFNKFQ